MARRIDHPLYGTWQQMMARCYNAKNIGFARYGGRGVTVCEQWHDLRSFTDWIEQNLGPRPAGHSIDRIDNDGNYEPGNLRWATPRVQSRNKRRGGPRPGFRSAVRYWPAV